MFSLNPVGDHVDYVYKGNDRRLGGMRNQLYSALSENGVNHNGQCLSRFYRLRSLYAVASHGGSLALPTISSFDIDKILCAH